MARCALTPSPSLLLLRHSPLLAVALSPCTPSPVCISATPCIRSRPPHAQQARVSCDGEQVHERCVVRSPEGQAAAVRAAAAAPPLTSEEAQQQAHADGLAMRLADNKTGYSFVNLSNPGHPKPYQARVMHDDKQVHLGYFATAEEAALCVARSLEARPAAEQSLTRSAVPALYRTQEEGEEEAREEEAEPPLFFSFLVGWESFL